MLHYCNQIILLIALTIYVFWNLCNYLHSFNYIRLKEYENPIAPILRHLQREKERTLVIWRSVK
jgi:hypothetical protein